ncbi:MAG: tripartite tricarboxylate transporter substrate binding protein, partial [Oscillospiraceae bacterium]|nr:tripartite tricarboxylate transporter substrate binding protein [Oscillospiraceae bacterium]
MKKRLLALLLAGTMALALAACGNKDDGKDPNPTTPVVENTENGGNETTAWAPDGPVSLIVAYAAGNGTDITARVLAQYASKYVGQNIVVENVDGGSGSIGWSQLADSDPDGMTIGFINLPNFNSSIVNELGTYTIDDFVGICNHVTETSLVIV